MLLGVSGLWSFARDFPKENTRFPPWAFPINSKKRKPINKIGAKLKNIDIKKDWVGTFTSHAFGGGLLVNNSITSGSWPETYEAYSFLEPFT